MPVRCPDCGLELNSRKRLRKHYGKFTCNWLSDWNYETARRDDFDLIMYLIDASHSKTKIAYIDFGGYRRLSLLKAFNSIAEIGCGRHGKGEGLALPVATTCLKLYPSLKILGVDRKRRVVKGNSVRSMGVDNISFQRDMLPSLPSICWKFDLVICLKTLRYVKDNLHAIRRLWELVKPGGLLYFDFPSDDFRKDIDEKCWLLKQASLMKDAKKEERRYRLIIQGDNLLEFKQIRSELEKNNCLKRIIERKDNYVIAIKAR